MFSEIKPKDFECFVIGCISKEDLSAPPRYLYSQRVQSMEHKPNSERLSRTHVWTNENLYLDHYSIVILFGSGINNNQSISFTLLSFFDPQNADEWNGSDFRLRMLNVPDLIVANPV